MGENDYNNDSGCGCTGGVNADGTPCCSSGGSSPVGPGKKIFAFTLVMVIAIGLAGYSFSRKMNGAPGDAVTCGTTLPSVHVADEIIAQKKVAYVFLAGDDAGRSRDVSLLVESVVSKLTNQGKPAVAITLEKGAEGYEELLDGLNVESLPCVIVAGYGSQISTLQTDISEEKLLRAFVLATTTAPECGPNSSPGCCPK